VLETAATDLTDAGDGSAGGVHIAALGGLWQAALFGFAGVTLRAEALGLDPHPPPDWQTLGFHVHWRGRLVRVRIDQPAGELSAALVTGDAMPIVVRGQRHTLRPGDTFRSRYEAAAAPGG